MSAKVDKILANPIEYFRTFVSVKRNLIESMTPQTEEKRLELRGRVLAYDDILEEINKVESLVYEESISVAFVDFQETSNVDITNGLDL